MNEASDCLLDPLILLPGIAEQAEYNRVRFNIIIYIHKLNTEEYILVDLTFLTLSRFGKLEKVDKNCLANSL